MERVRSARAASLIVALWVWSCFFKASISSLWALSWGCFGSNFLRSSAKSRWPSLVAPTACWNWIIATLAGVAAGAAEAGTGALGIGVAGAALLAWASAVAPNPDARMQTNVNERFMRFYNSFILLIEIARVVAEAYLAPWSISCALLRRFFCLEAKNAEKRHGQRTFTGTTQIIGGRDGAGQRSPPAKEASAEKKQSAKSKSAKKQVSQNSLGRGIL